MGIFCKLTFLAVSLTSFAALTANLSFIQLIPLLLSLTLTFSLFFSAILFELF